MYELFHFPTNKNVGVTKSPQWINIRRGLDSNLQKVKTYYSNANFFIRSNHILTKIITHVGLRMDLSDSEYYSYLNNEALVIARLFKLSNPTSYGEVQVNHFFGPGIREVILAHDEDFDYRKVIKDYENAQAVKVLYHPFSDLSIPILNNINKSKKTGYAVIALNIPLLLMQYRAFLTDKNHPEYRHYTVGMFIRKFVLPNTCDEVLDIAIFNRLVCIYKDETPNENSYEHPFFLQNWDSRADAVLLEIANRLKSRNALFFKTLNDIPLVTLENLTELLPLPDIYRSNRIFWVLILARLEFIYFLYRNDADTYKFGEANRGLKGNIRRFLELRNIDRYLKRFLPEEMYRDVQQKITDIIAMS